MSNVEGQFGQQITTLVSAFAALTQTDQMVNQQFTEQLCSVGLLVQLEGLLSCYGGELCMLEDTIVGVDDLNHVTFRLVLANEKDFTPKASLGRYSLACRTLPAYITCIFSTISLHSSSYF